MIDDRRARIEALFEGALEQPPGARALWLAAACPDAALRADVDRLLAAHERAGILERPLTSVAEDVKVSPPTSAAPPQGRIGPYELGEEIGRGGMGIVVAAFDHVRRRRVAIKVLSPEAADTPQRRARFEAEAHAASRLDHPGVARVLDVGETGDGHLYLVMEHCEGRTLEALIEEGPLDADTARTIAVGIAEALACAHHAGVVHRDIKPSNVMIGPDGAPRILDFGIAKLLDGPGMTQTGMRLGTVAYMSPEQARGERVDARADLWSLGVVLYEMLTARRPFVGRTPAAIVHAILTSDPPPPSAHGAHISTALDRIVLRTLQKDRAARHASASALVADLDASRVPHDDARARLAALDENARALLRRLAVFDAPFTLTDVEALADLAGAYEVDAVDALEELLEGALVERAETDAGDSSFTIADDVRDAALEALHEAGEADGVRHRLDGLSAPED